VKEQKVTSTFLGCIKIWDILVSMNSLHTLNILQLSGFPDRHINSGAFCLIMYLTTLNLSLCTLKSSGLAAVAIYESEMPDK
jgi:hypothetical protein